MLDFFNTYENYLFRSLRHHPRWRNINLNARINVEKVIKYCRKVESHGVTHVNILTKIIEKFSNGIELEQDLYQRELVSRGLDLTPFGIVTERSYGQIHKDLFYKDSNEIIIETSKFIDMNTFNSYWKLYTPFRILYTPDHDLDFEAKEKSKSIHGGVAVYELEPMRLMLMYRKWALERLKNNLPITARIFLTQIVFPNMIFESININYFNRFIYLIQNDKLPDDKFERNYPFYQVEITRFADQCLMDVYEDYKDTAVLYGRLINTLPCFNILESKPKEMMFYLRTRIPITKRQTSWVLWVSRLHYIRVLLEFLGENGFKYNRDLYTKFQKHFLLLRSRGYYIPNELPENFRLQFQDDIDYIKTNVFPNLKF